MFTVSSSGPTLTIARASIGVVVPPIPSIPPLCAASCVIAPFAGSISTREIVPSKRARVIHDLQLPQRVEVDQSVRHAAGARRLRRRAAFHRDRIRPDGCHLVEGDDEGARLPLTCSATTLRAVRSRSGCSTYPSFVPSWTETMAMLFSVCASMVAPLTALAGACAAAAQDGDLDRCRRTNRPPAASPAAMKRRTIVLMLLCSRPPARRGRCVGRG